MCVVSISTLNLHLTCIFKNIRRSSVAPTSIIYKEKHKNLSKPRKNHKYSIERRPSRHYHHHPSHIHSTNNHANKNKNTIRLKKSTALMKYLEKARYFWKKYSLSHKSALPIKSKNHHLISQKKKKISKKHKRDKHSKKTYLINGLYTKQ